MQAYYCLVAELTLVAGLTLVTGVCLVTCCIFNHMQASSSRGSCCGSRAYCGSGAYSSSSTTHDIVTNICSMVCFVFAQCIVSTIINSFVIDVLSLRAAVAVVVVFVVVVENYAFTKVKQLCLQFACLATNRKRNKIALTKINCSTVQRFRRVEW